MGPHRFDPRGKLRKLIFDGEDHDKPLKFRGNYSNFRQTHISWEYHEKNRKNQDNDWVLISKHVEKNDRDAMTPTVLSKAIGLFKQCFCKPITKSIRNKSGFVPENHI